MSMVYDVPCLVAGTPKAFCGYSYYLQEAFLIKKGGEPNMEELKEKVIEKLNTALDADPINYQVVNSLTGLLDSVCNIQNKE